MPEAQDQTSTRGRETNSSAWQGDDSHPRAWGSAYPVPTWSSCHVCDTGLGGSPGPASTCSFPTGLKWRGCLDLLLSCRQGGSHLSPPLWRLFSKAITLRNLTTEIQTFKGRCTLTAQVSHQTHLLLLPDLWDVSSLVLPTVLSWFLPGSFTAGDVTTQWQAEAVNSGTEWPRPVQETVLQTTRLWGHRAWVLRSLLFPTAFCEVTSMQAHGTLALN